MHRGRTNPRAFLGIWPRNLVVGVIRTRRNLPDENVPQSFWGSSRYVEPRFDSAFRNRTGVRIDLSSLQIGRVKAGQGVGPVALELGLVEQTLRY